MKPIAAV